MSTKNSSKSPSKASNIKKLQKQLADVTTSWHRALADYQNLLKRTSQQQAHQSRLASKVLILKLLPVYDHLLLASDTIQDAGLSLVVDDFNSVLQSEGVTQVDAKPGIQFNPTTHECVKLDKKGQSGKIVSQLKPGYFLASELLYPAKVTVGG